MADAPLGKEEARRPSVVSNELVQQGLASEDDAAVLGTVSDSTTILLKANMNGS